MNETKDIDPKLLEILVCPLTKGPLRYDRERSELISDQAHLVRELRALSGLTPGQYRRLAPTWSRHVPLA